MNVVLIGVDVELVEEDGFVVVVVELIEDEEDIDSVVELVNVKLIGVVNVLTFAFNNYLKYTALKLKNISCEFYINYRKIRLIFIIFCKFSEFYLCKSS